MHKYLQHVHMAYTLAQRAHMACVKMDQTANLAYDKVIIGRYESGRWLLVII